MPATSRNPSRGAPFLISLAEWSLHRALFARKLSHLDFPKIAKQDFDIDAIELVNTFFGSKGEDKAYLTDFKRRADDLGVRILLIMCDFEGSLGHAKDAKRREAVQNHLKWLDAAKFFGCHSIRVNARSSGTFEDQLHRTAEGLRMLCEHAAKLDLNVLIENHGGFSSNPSWLVGLIKKVGLPNCGTLPDFGNFRVGFFKEYDRYEGVAQMMPLAKGVSAKSMNFDKQGNETRVDYLRMMKIVVEAGYHDYVGIEYSGLRLSEHNGIRATKRLLEKVKSGI
ncbi:MAG TPA: sugar phosphate isomerase/epimerase family protein [Candidatus Dormibacteraeota bacterium]|nr:sugar phosphate isomerase/epimerase family protein [Candidatus Dormibacteraeota bacterium]